MKIKTHTFLAGTGLLAFACLAQAQTASPPASADSGAKSEFALEEIVVTARRREESLEDVPQVIDAVTSEALAKFSIQKFDDVQALVPGLTLKTDGSGNGSSATIRGVDFSLQSSTSGSVALYINDVQEETTTVFNSLYDIGQIEVLRGPQGTLRGQSAPSGAITVTTHKASTAEFGGYAQVLGTNRHQVKVDGAFNMPVIKDVFAIRLAGMIDDNHFDNLNSLYSSAEPHDHTKSGRISLAFTPGDAFALNVMYQHVNRASRFYQQVAGSGAPASAFGTCQLQTGATTTTSIPCPAAGYNGPVLTPEDRLAVSNQPQSRDMKDDYLTAQADYRFAGQKLSYVGGFDALHYTTTTDKADGGHSVVGGVVPPEVTKPDSAKISHELRLASEERVFNRFDYTAGLYFSVSHVTVDLPDWPVSALSGAFGSPLGLPSPSVFDPRYLIHTHVRSSLRNEEKSGFASITWHIDDKTELTGGGRYIVAKADSDLSGNLLSDGLIALPPSALGIPAGTPCGFIPVAVGQTYANTCDFPSALVTPSATILASKSTNRWTPKVWSAALSHHFTDDLLVYLNYGTAWRRGTTTIGIQNASGDPVLTNLTQVEPETSKGVELGLKSTFFDRRARINLAVYDQKYDGYIYYTPFVNYLADSGAGAAVATPFQFTTNVPAKVWGVDFDSTLQLSTHWNVGLAASYAKSQMDNATVPCNGPIPAGQHIALCQSNASVTTAAPWNAKLSSEYSLPLAASFDGYVRGLLTYYPKNDRASGDGAGFTAPAYGILNFYTGVRSADGAWDVQLFARNLNNARKTLTYDQTMQNSAVSPVNMNFGPSGYFATSVTPLREFGLTVRYAFGSR